MRIAVYTCITGNYNELRAPRVVNNNIDYYCFHDGKIDIVAPWVGVVLKSDLDLKDLNREIKIKPVLSGELRKYDLTIYVDGSIEILSDLQQLIDHVISLEGHTFMYNHNLRTCVYNECEECYLSGKISFDACSKMLSFLRNEGIYEDFGLFEAGVIIRKGWEKESIELMDIWWQNYLSSFGVKRDQISLVYSLWKSGIVIVGIGAPDFYSTHLNFEISHHTKNTRIKRLLNWYVLRHVRRIFMNVFMNERRIS